MSESNEQEITPMMRQYREVKDRYPDTLVFFRLGDFYELFFDDARKASRLLDLTLTHRGTAGGVPIPMAGVPFHSCDTYIARLIRAGESVVICEQSGEVLKGRPMTREVTRVITPGTATDEGIAPDHRDNCVASVFAGRGCVGFAYLSLGSGTFKAGICGGMRELALYLEKIAPAEIVYPESLKDTGAFERIVSRRSLPDWNFDFEACYRLLCRQFQTVSLIGFDIESLDEGIRAAGALLAYVKSTQNVPLCHIRSIGREDHGANVILDGCAQRNLELLANLRGGSRGSLFATIDRTRTPMGGRLLQAALTAPLRDRRRVAERQDCVSELLDLPDDGLDELLRGVGDLERVCARIGLGSSRPKDFVVLRQALRLMPALKEVLTAPGTPALTAFADTLTVQEDLCRLLERAIAVNPSTFLRDGGVIADGYSSRLDELRALVAGSGSLLESIAAREREATGIPTLKVGYNSVHGYYIELPKSQAARAPASYQRRQTLKNNERYITPELKELEEKTLTAQSASLELEKELFGELIRTLQSRLPELSELSRRLALLDMLQSFAAQARAGDYVRPELCAEAVIEIDDGRHPVIETLSGRPFVPNSIKLGENKMMIITGPNMGGKSTFMRQTALICVLAKIGSFVPAARARIGDIDRIFTRIGAADDLASGRSTFMVEMEEAASILNNATSSSLVIMDEIGRGTSTLEGAAIARSIALYLYHKIRCFTLFSTHYPELAGLGEELPRVLNVCFRAEKSRGGIVFLYRALAGTESYAYAAEVGRLAGLPAEVTRQAAAFIASQRGAGRGAAPAPIRPPPPEEPAPGVLEVLSCLKELKPDEITPLEALNLLSRLHGRL